MNRKLAALARLPRRVEPRTAAPAAAPRIAVHRGYFILCLAEPAGPRGWLGRASIWTEHPDGSGAAAAVQRVRSVGCYARPQDAMYAAEFQARQIVEGLAPNWHPFGEPGREGAD